MVSNRKMLTFVTSLKVWGRGDMGDWKILINTAEREREKKSWMIRAIKIRQQKLLYIYGDQSKRNFPVKKQGLSDFLKNK